MGKTSPVVVPITADLNPFRNAMRGLRSSFTGGGGAGTGGFGSGGNNAGGVGYGGGGGGSGIVGTAIGAGLGARLGTTKGVAGKAPTFVERMKEHFEVNERRQVMASAQRNVARAERAKNAALLRYGGSSQQYTFADMDLDEAMREQSAYRKYYQPHRRAGRAMGRMGQALGRGYMGVNNALGGAAAANLLGRLGVPAAAAGALGAAALPVAGVAAVGMAGAAASRFKESQYARFSNFEQYEGTKYYDIARREAARRPKEDSIGWWNKMWMEESKSGGKMSAALEAAGGVFENVTSAIGSGMGMGTSGIMGGLADLALSSMGLSPSKGSLFNAVRMAY